MEQVYEYLKGINDALEGLTDFRMTRHNMQILTAVMNTTDEIAKILHKLNDTPKDASEEAIPIEVNFGDVEGAEQK